MRHLIYIIALLPVAVTADESANYINFIRQIQQDSGVEWDVTVAPKGSTLSPTGVSKHGSFFELWSIHGFSVTEHLLDEQFVTSYTPNARIEIQTGDPYGPVRRTRVDQPFKVLVTVTGLLEGGDPSVPEAARMVDYTHATFPYAAGEHSVADSDVTSGVLREEGYMEVNGTATIRFATTNLTGPDLTTMSGEEVFTISAKADYGVSASVLDSKKLQIWPVATGSFQGYDSSVKYDTVPPVTVSLNDLYPASATYVRLYLGPPQANPSNATLVPESYVLIADSVPQNRKVTLKELDYLFLKDGLHTVEILHDTPFGTDLLATGSIQVDRTIEVIGTVNSND